MSPNVRAMNEPVLFAGALSHRSLGNREKTRQYLESILGRNSRSIAATMLLGEELLRSNEVSRAAPLIESVLRQNPDDPMALSMMGRIHLARRQFNKAAEMLDKASRKSPASASLRDLSFSQFALGQERLAVQNLEKAYAANPGDSNTAMELAVYHARRGDARRAVQVAEALVAKEPENLAMLNFLGNIKGRLRDRKGMKDAYERALAKDPKFKPVVQNLSWLDMDEGNLDSARARLRGFLKDNPRDADVLYQVGVIELTAGRRAEAVGLWTQADTLQPKDPRSLLALIDLHLREGQLDEALSAGRTLQARFPESPQALMATARTYAARREPAIARQVLLDAVKAAGFETDMLVSLSRQLGQLAALDDASHAVNKALQATPDDPQALALRVELAARRGQGAEVDKALSALQAKHPSLPITLVTAGHVAFSREQYPRAVTLYKQVFDREPTTPLALNLAQAYAATRQADKGVALLKTWATRVPQDAVAQRALADMQLFAGQPEEARKTYAGLVQRFPNDAGLLAAQASLLARIGDPGALAVVERAHKMAPGNSQIADSYGWLLLRSGNTAGAVSVLREARLRDPANAVLRWHLAAALHKAGRLEEAREELRTALAANPPADPELDSLRKALGI
jgi:putative PEP-CTERM system TPR-repeat lipoprotein